MKTNAGTGSKKTGGCGDNLVVTTPFNPTWTPQKNQAQNLKTKKVKVDDLRPGVYIHDFNCNWKGGIIYLEQNLIEDENVIDILKSWKIKEVLIDTEKGLDVKRAQSGHTERERTKEPAPDQTYQVTRPEVPLSRELQSAQQLSQEAIDIVEQTTRQLVAGKVPDIEPSYTLAARMYESVRRNRDALLLLTRIRTKDEYTLYHSLSVSSLMMNMCHYYGMPESKSLDLAVGALFHDIGKALVPERILTKPARLTNEEFCEIQRHSEHSVTLLAKAKGLPFECYDIALHHHERYDGSGYPHGLKEEEISRGAQITSVCDVFDAVTSERCYKPGMDTVAGLRIIYEGGGKSFSKTSSTILFSASVCIPSAPPWFWPTAEAVWW